MTKIKLLIVEDDLDLAEMLSAYFRVQNYIVLTAAWGEEALKISREEADLGLVMLDIRLPDIDGYEICRQLRLHRQTKYTPVIFLTEKSDRINKLQGLELGVVDYITKPFDIQELRLRVRNAIGRTSRESFLNPVTELPEGNLVDERLASLLFDQGWAVLRVAIDKLEGFREKYGFVAADDVLRAVSLIVKNAVHEFGEDKGFVGHTDAETFVIITTPEQAPKIQTRLDTRIQQSREYFYPLQERDQVHQTTDPDYLNVNSYIVDHSTAKYQNVDELKMALSRKSSRV